MAQPEPAQDGVGLDKDEIIYMLRAELGAARENKVGLPYPEHYTQPHSGSYYS